MAVYSSDLFQAEETEERRVVARDGEVASVVALHRLERGGQGVVGADRSAVKACDRRGGQSAVEGRFEIAAFDGADQLVLVNEQRDVHVVVAEERA
jgi:hypothetical protein